MYILRTFGDFCLLIYGMWQSLPRISFHSLKLRAKLSPLHSQKELPKWYRSESDNRQ